MTSTLEKTPSELFQWLIDVHNELGLKNFSDAESKRFGTLNVQVPAPASRVESGINKTKEFLEKFDIVVSPLSNLHSTAAIVIGVLKFVLMVGSQNVRILGEINPTLEMLDHRLPPLLGTSFPEQTYKQALTKTVHRLLEFFVKITEYAMKQAPTSFPRRIRTIFRDSEKDFKEMRQNLDQLIGHAYEEMSVNLHQGTLERIPAVVRDQHRETREVIYDQTLPEISYRLAGANSEDQLSQKLQCVYEESSQYSTCAWSNNHPSIRPWLVADFATSRTFRLIICGNPGTGKSVLMAYLIDQLLPLNPKPNDVYSRLSTAGRYSSPDELVLYCFCGLNYSVKGTVQAPILKLRDDRHNQIDKWPIDVILRTFLRQMIAKWDPDYTQLRQPLVYELRKSLMSHDMSPEQLMGHFIPLLKTYSRSCIIIDALDQCHEPGAFIAQLLEQAPESCRIILSSRDDSYVEDHVKEWPRVRLGDEGTTPDSLCQYITWRLSQVEDKYCRNRENPDLKVRLNDPDLQEILLAKAQNMFLYLSSLFWSVMNPGPQGANRVLELLCNPPDNLHDVYAIILARHLWENSQTTSSYDDLVLICALQLILHSRQPVTWTLLCSALSFQENISFTVENIQRCMTRAQGSLFEVQKAINGIPILALPHETWRTHFADFEFDPDKLDGVTERGERSRAVKLVVDTRLSRLYREVRRVAAHMSLFQTCSRVLCHDNVRTAIVQFHNSTDARRRILDSTSKWERKWPDCDLLTSVGRQEVDIRRLESQLFQDEDWTRWLLRQTNYLDLDRQWRDKQKESREKFMLRHSDNYTFHKISDVEDEMELQSRLGQEALTLLDVAKDRELLAYSFRHVFCHLSWIFCEIQPKKPHPDFIAIMRTFLNSMDRHVSLVAQKVIDDHKNKTVAGCYPRSTSRDAEDPDHIDVLVNIATTLQSLTTIIDFIRLYIDAPESWSLKPLAIMQSTSFDFLYQTVFTPCDIWEESVLLKLDGVASCGTLWATFKFANGILATLRDAELTLFKAPRLAVGLGNVIDAIQHLRCMLSQWIILHHHNAMNRSLLQDELPEPLGVQHGFLYPKLLRTLNLETCAVEEYHHLTGVLLVDVDLWQYHQSLYTGVWMACFAFGAVALHRFWILALVISLFSESHGDRVTKYSPSSPRRMMFSFPPFIVAGWLAAHLWRSHIGLLVGISAFAAVMYTSGFINLQRGTSQGYLRVKVELNVGLRGLAQVFIRDVVPPCHAHATIATVISGVHPLSHAMNVAAALYAIHNAVRYLSDPDGLQHSLAVLQAIRARNSVIEQTPPIMPSYNARLT